MEEFKEQEFFEDRANAERAIYGDDFLELFDNSIDEKLKLEARIAKKHKRKEECCTIWRKHSDGLGKHFTKRANPCRCPECAKCNPSKIENYKNSIYNNTPLSGLTSLRVL